MNISDLRKETSTARYKYLLVVDGKEIWLNISKLEARPEAIISRKAISLRLNSMFSHPDSCGFKSVMDCISKPRRDTKKAEADPIDMAEAFSLMDKSLRKRNG